MCVACPARRPGRHCRSLRGCSAFDRRGAGVVAPATPTSTQFHDASRDDFRTHLESLIALVDACAQARDTKTCDPAQVGTDDSVPLGSSVTPAQSGAPNAERRLVRYGWLRVLLSKAQDKDAPASKANAAPPGSEANQWLNVRPIPPTTAELLASAHKRLAADLAQAGQAPAPLPDNAAERAVMKQVLAAATLPAWRRPTPKTRRLRKSAIGSTACWRTRSA